MALCSVVCAALLTGCQSTDRGAEQLADYREQLTRATESIAASDFESAYRHAAEAERLASTEPQKQKALSLRYLVAGTELYAEGDVLGAKAQWELITDAVLYREVRRKASDIGISLPKPNTVGSAEPAQEDES
ncbi:MAG: hypothetical protein AAGG38_07610 [Planctomycetota bacterium]